MATEKFRRQLLEEGQQWQRDGLLSSDQWQQLIDRYQLDRLEVQAQNRFTLILISVGCILIGLGVITYVAANWEWLARELRVLLLFSVFVGVSLGGFTLWQRSRDGLSQRLGQGLLLLGSLILGANMALMAQMFHLSGPTHRLFLTWGLGVLVMAYGLRLTVLGMLAILLLGIGYWAGWGETGYFWFWGVPAPSEGSLYGLFLQNMPFFAGALYLPLAYLCRSRVIFTFAAIAVSSSLVNQWYSYASVGGSVVSAIALILPGMLLWSYDDTLWSDLRLRRSSITLSMNSAISQFSSIARKISIAYLGGLLYITSFSWITRPVAHSYREISEYSWQLQSIPSFLIVVVLAVAQWVYLVRSMRQESADRRLSTIVVASFWLIIGALAVLDSSDGAITFLVNILLAVLAIGLLRESIGNGQRLTFWFGLVLLTLQIISRLLQYDTDLLFKAFMFFLCGVAVIASGIWFERYARPLRSSN